MERDDALGRKRGIFAGFLRFLNFSSVIESIGCMNQGLGNLIKVD